MWNKKIYISQHMIKRFEERHISYMKHHKGTKNIYGQVKADLRPLNVVMINRLKTGSTEIITKQGKVYIAKEKPNSIYIQTVYQKNLKKLIKRRENFKNRYIN